MFGALPVLEAAGPRMMSHGPPRGTPSRVLSTRLQRRPALILHKARLDVTAALTRPPTIAIPIGGGCRRYSTATVLVADSARLTEDDAHFLKGLVQSHGHQAPTDTIIDRVNMALQPHPDPMVDGVSSPDPTDRAQTLPKLFKSALAAMQKQDSRWLLSILREIAALPQDELEDGVAALPSTTFSEFLRTLDPIANDIQDDPTHGTAIYGSAWQILSMDRVIDVWGVRTLHSKLLHQMFTLMQALRQNGRNLSINDYTPLLRVAGLCSDNVVAKMLWEQMRHDGITDWRHGASYAEFLRARWLVHPAYYGYDKTRMMMTPRNLHKRGPTKRMAKPVWQIYLHPRTTGRLDRLRYSMRRRSFKFGLNRNLDYAEDLSRTTRKRMPITRMFYEYGLHGVQLDEDVLCAFMIAFGRAGSMRFIQHRILEDSYGIRVVPHPDGHLHIEPASGKTRPQVEFAKRPLLPSLRPSQKLMEAVVTAYCCNGQISWALAIIDYIATKYGIPITPKVWCDLLEWTYILGSAGHSTAWNMAQFYNFVPRADGVEMIWNAMTSPPYNIQPGFKQYDLMIRSLVRQKRLTEAVEYMRAARKFYDAHCREYERAAMVADRSLRDGANRSAANRRFQRARFHKEYMWLRMNGWCDMIFKRGLGLSDEEVTRAVPDLIAEWHEFVSNPVRYKTAAGYVLLTDPSEPIIKGYHLREVALSVPQHRRDRGTRDIHGDYIPLNIDPQGSRVIRSRYGIRKSVRKQYSFRSKHALLNLMSGKVSPIELLRGDHPSQRDPVKMKGFRKTTTPVAAQEQQQRGRIEDAPTVADDWDDDDDW